MTKMTPSNRLRTKSIRLHACVSALWLGVWNLHLADVADGFPKTCYGVQQSGGSDGPYILDPEQDGLDPISVFCNMSSTPVTAVLHHNRENWTHVEGYEEPGSYNGQILYDNGVTMQQVRGLIMASIQCTHALNIQSHEVRSEKSFWESYFGRIDRFETLGGTLCLQDTGERKCRCLWNVMQKTSCVGDVGNWPLLPLGSFRFGDTGNPWEYVNFRVGPLVCKQDAMISRRFQRHDGIRETSNVTEIHGIRSMFECSSACVQESMECVGFNFKKGFPTKCELSNVPLDAPNAHIVTEPLWVHFAIKP